LNFIRENVANSRPQQVTLEYHMSWSNYGIKINKELKKT